MEKKYVVEVEETTEHPCEALCGGTSTYTMNAKELVEFMSELMVEHDYKKLGRHCNSWYAEWDRGLYFCTSTVSVREQA